MGKLERVRKEGVKRDKFGATIRKREERCAKEKSVKGFEGRWKILREKRGFMSGVVSRVSYGERHRARNSKLIGCCRRDNAKTDLRLYGKP